MMDTIATNVGRVRVNLLKSNDIRILLDGISKDSNMIEYLDELILFGSSITNVVKDSSDIDMCILTNMEPYEFHLRILSEFMLNIRKNGFKSATDIFVYRDREELSMENRNTVQGTILQEGITVYLGGKRDETED